MFQQFLQVIVFDMSRQNIFQNFVIDICKKFPDVALQNPTRTRMIFRNDATKFRETIHGFVRSFVDTARIRIKNKFLIKVRIKLKMNQMMKQPVANGCFVNVSWFRI